MTTYQEDRKRLQHEVRERARVDAVVRALLAVAGRTGSIEYAALSRGSNRSEPVDEAARIAADQGFDDTRLIAFRGLARSRGIDLADVLRAALKGELRSVVELPAVNKKRPEGEDRDALDR